MSAGDPLGDVKWREMGGWPAAYNNVSEVIKKHKLEHLRQIFAELDRKHRRSRMKSPLPFKVPAQTMSPVPFGEPKQEPRNWWWTSPNAGGYVHIPQLYDMTFTSNTPIWTTQTTTTTLDTAIPYHYQTQ